MQIEVYKMTADADSISITLEAVCDSFSSLLWDIECYQCGAFEVYIAANSQNIEIFQTGRIIGRDDDKEHFGIIESVKIDRCRKRRLSDRFRQIFNVSAGAENYLSNIFSDFTDKIQ